MSSINRDQELLQLLKNDDVEAFNALYEKYFSRIYSLAYQALNEKSLVEDAVIPVFVHLWDKRHTHEIDSLENYMFVLACKRISYVMQSANRSTSQKLPAVFVRKIRTIFPVLSTFMITKFRMRRTY